MANINLGVTAGKIWDETGTVTFKLSDLNKAFREAVVQLLSGTWDQDEITANSLDGTIAGNVADDNAIGGLPVIHRIDAAGSTSGTTNYDITLTHKTRIIGVFFLLRAAGSAGDTVQIKETANAITELVQISGTQKEPVLIEVSPSGGSTANYDTVIDDAIRVVDFWAYNEAAGTASDTLTLADGSGNNVSTSLDMSVGNTVLVRTALIDDAYRDFAAGATIRVEQVDGGGSDCPASKAYISGYKTGGNDTYIYFAKTLDDGEYEIPAAGTLRLAQVDGGGSDCPALTAYILGIRVA